MHHCTTEQSQGNMGAPNDDSSKLQSDILR